MSRAAEEAQAAAAAMAMVSQDQAAAAAATAAAGSDAFLSGRYDIKLALVTYETQHTSNHYVPLQAATELEYRVELLNRYCVFEAAVLLPPRLQQLCVRAQQQWQRAPTITECMAV
jgi:hypothetical protein